MIPQYMIGKTQIPSFQGNEFPIYNIGHTTIKPLQKTSQILELKLHDLI